MDTEMISITKLEYDNLLFRENQIMELNKLVDRAEQGELDGMDFAEEVINIL